MINISIGDYDDDLNFEISDGAVAHYGCGATLFGEFWYFGGGTGGTDANSQKRKVGNPFRHLVALTSWRNYFFR